MHGFTIGDAWSYAMDFLQRNLQMLAILVGGGAIAAGLTQLVAMGGSPQALAEQMAAAMRSGNPEMLTQLGGGAIAVSSLLGYLVQSTTQYAGLRLGLGHGDSTADALVYGLKASVLMLLFLMAVILVVGLGVGLVAVALGAGAMASGAGAGMAIGLILLLLVLLFVMLWLVARLSVAAPAMADAGSINPLYGIATSWRLTADRQWSILGYIILLAIAAGVISSLAQAIFGLFGATVGSALSVVVVTAPIAVVTIAVYAGIYLTVARRDTGDVFA
jgi:hypothetical protein